MIDSGIFTLKTPEQLFKKLVRDHTYLVSSPLDTDAWFNFVVTADHLPEWESGGDALAAHRLRDQEPLLRICNHLARNAKHFKAEDQRKRQGHVILNAIASTNEVRVVAMDGASVGAAGSRPVPQARPHQPQHEFTLELSPREEAELGVTTLSALELAGCIVAFWRARLQAE
jgi:hypothetical protein